jgi:hypothetical protein
MKSFLKANLTQPFPQGGYGVLCLTAGFFLFAIIFGAGRYHDSVSPLLESLQNMKFIDSGGAGQVYEANIWGWLNKARNRGRRLGQR